MQRNEEMISWRGVAKKRREHEMAKKAVKSSGTVASAQHSWPDGNDRWMP
jgi:hypothetical protein